MFALPSVSLIYVFGTSDLRVAQLLSPDANPKRPITRVLLWKRRYFYMPNGVNENTYRKMMIVYRE